MKRPQTSASSAKASPLVVKNWDHNKSISKKKAVEETLREQKELELKKKEELKREEKRKMIAEKKLVLKQKLSAIKIQKFWRARIRRRRIKLEHLKYISSIRRIQKWYRKYQVFKKRNEEILNIWKSKHINKVLKIQRNFRKHKSMIKKINMKRFKANFLAAIKGWRIRRILAILKNDEKVREAIDIIKLNLDTKIKKGNNLFFKQFIDKYPEMMQLFHSKFEELYQKQGWFEKPITKVKILVIFYLI